MYDTNQQTNEHLFVHTKYQKFNFIFKLQVSPAIQNMYTYLQMQIQMNNTTEVMIQDEPEMCVRMMFKFSLQTPCTTDMSYCVLAIL